LDGLIVATQWGRAKGAATDPHKVIGLHGRTHIQQDNVVERGDNQKETLDPPTTELVLVPPKTNHQEVANGQGPIVHGAAEEP